MELEVKEKYIYRFFEYSLILKIINGIWETILSLYILSGGSLRDIVFHFTNREIIRDPDDFFALHIQNFASRFTHGTELFIAIYLLIQGIIKIILITGLLQKKLWAYPTATFAFFAIVFYQIYRYSHTHSPFLILFSLFDLVTIMLVQHEYKRAKKHLPNY